MVDLSDFIAHYMFYIYENDSVMTEMYAIAKKKSDYV